MGNCQNNTKQIPQTKPISQTKPKLKVTNNEDNDDEYVFKIVMVGNSSVGKSSFVTRVARNEFSIDTKSTIGVDFYVKRIKVKNNNKLIPVKVQLWDTAGQDRYRAITSAYYRGAHCVIAMYSTTDYSSFERLTSWIKEVKDNSPNVVLAIVGTKIDLTHKRMIDKNVAREYAKSCKAKYYEISAMANEGCTELLNDVVKDIIEFYFKDE